jgi:acyl-CoA synthetase (AMP-forming)/AMP-acid ligase II
MSDSLSQPQWANIAACLPEMARERPNQVAIVETIGRLNGEREFATLTFAQLDARTNQIARGLLHIGMQPGERIVVMVKPSRDFFAVMFALWKAGLVPVLIDPGLGRRQLKQCLAEVAPHGFIGIPLAQLARVLLGWGKPTVRHVVTVGSRWLWSGKTLDEVLRLGESGDPVMAQTSGEDLAAVLFTSGSTGVAKGVEYQHRHFIAQVELIRATYGIVPGEIDLPTFPPFALFDPALGMTTILPQMDFTQPANVNPAELAELIQHFQVTNVFGSPALLATVSRDALTSGLKWRTVRRVISAGAPASVQTLERMKLVLPKDVQVFTPYGATECMPVSNIGSRTVLGETRAATEQGAGVCVGEIVAPNDVRIIAIVDGALAHWEDVKELPAGEIGEICVSGPTATRAYFGRQKANDLAKIQDGERLWHRMGDTGYKDPQGRLWYCGRKSHRVQMADRVLHTAPVEEVLNTHPAVRRTALVPVTVGGIVQPLACVEREPGQPMAETQLFAELTEMAKPFGITRFLVHPAFPVDIRHNAKIGREILAVWAQKQVP